MRKAPIWNYFVLKTEPHGKFAVCNLCQAPLKYQNSTSSLQYHVKSKHKDKLKGLPIQSQKAQKHRLEDDDSAIVNAGPSADPPPIKKLKIEPASPIKKLQQPTIKKALTVRCIEKDIAEMAALNNFTYNQIATCSFIQEGLQNVHQKKASSHKSVAKHVSNYAKK